MAHWTTLVCRDLEDLRDRENAEEARQQEEGQPFGSPRSTAASSFGSVQDDPTIERFIPERLLDDPMEDIPDFHLEFVRQKSYVSMPGRVVSGFIFQRS